MCVCDCWQRFQVNYRALTSSSHNPPRASPLLQALDRWLSVRLETLGNVVVFAAAVASVFLTRAGRLKVRL